MLATHESVSNRFLCLAVAIVAGGCTAAPRRNFEPQQIEAVLQRQVDAWNAADIAAFMEPYWHSPELTFSSGGQITRGWQAALENYRRRYPTAESMGGLTFSDLQIIPLGHDGALVLGRWRLSREHPIGGVFTLVMRRENGRWVIIHDHTSRDTP